MKKGRQRFLLKVFDKLDAVEIPKTRLVNRTLANELGQGNSRVNPFHFIEGQDSFVSTKEAIVKEIANIRSSLFKLP